MITSALPWVDIPTPTQIPRDGVVDNEIYLDQRLFDAEREELFYRSWTFALHKSEIQGEGDYRLVRIGQYEIIVCKDNQGELRAYHNACRHRSAPLVTAPSGTLNRFQCCYHLFFYRLGGELAGQGLGGELVGVAQPKGYETTPFKKEDFPLIPVEIREFHGLVFLRIRPGPMSFEEQYAHVLTDPHVLAILTDELEVFHFHQQTLATNWKLYTDNNRDQYHTNLHPFLRAVQASALRDPTKLRTRLLGGGHVILEDSSEYGPGTTDYGRAGYTESQSIQYENPMPGVKPGGFLILNLFPDVMINIRSNVMRIDRLIPVAPNSTIAEFRGLGLKGDSPEVRSGRVANHNLLWGLFGRNLPEDTLVTDWQYHRIASRSCRWSLIARDMEGGYTDELTNRVFYAEYQRRLGTDISYTPCGQR